MFQRARVRLVAWNVLVLALILVGLGTAVYTIFDRSLYADIDPILNTNGYAYGDQLVKDGIANPKSLVFCPPVWAVQPVLPAPVQVSPSDPGFVSMLDCHRRPGWKKPLVASELAAALTGKIIGPHTVEADDHYWRVYSRPVTYATDRGIVITAAVQVWLSADTQVHQIRRLLQVLIGGGIAGLLLAGIGGLFLADRSLVPIRQAFNRQRQFVADASHELRTPLTLIRSSAEMVAQSADSLEPEDAELLGDIVLEVDRLTHLVNDLLTLARADAGQVALEAAPVNIRALVAQVRDDVEPLAQAKQVELSTSADESGAPTIVLGDELRLRQLLLILLDNAIKYTDAGGRVDLDVGRQNGRIAVTVADSGVGIPAEALRHIFERFYRVDSARTHETGGAGLGLSIAQWIVQAHGGDIKVESERGASTSFRVELPASNEL